ncbi:MAG: GntR family transcriptional regulator [Lautropia sp.]
MDFNDKIARASLHVEVADRVREMIFERTLPPGFRIDELELSAKLGTSRTPLREALKVLANEGLVKLAPGRGAFVTELELHDLESLVPVLAMLEGRCVAEAVRRQTPADVRRLDAVQQKMELHVQAGDVQAFHQATDQFHQMLHSLAGNAWLMKITTDLRSFLRLARGQSRHPDNRLMQSLAEHRTLMRNIERGDADAAEQVMHHHLFAQLRAWKAARAQAPSTAPADATTHDAPHAPADARASVDVGGHPHGTAAGAAPFSASVGV